MPGSFGKLLAKTLDARAFVIDSALFFKVPRSSLFIFGIFRDFIMSLEKNDIEKIAHLARLGIHDADIPDYARNLSDILDLVEQMSAVDTRGVTPMAHPLDAQQRLRADEVTEVNQREQLQANAPQMEAGLFLVPQVIE